MAAASEHDTERIVMPGNYTVPNNTTTQPIEHGYDAGNKPNHVDGVDGYVDTFTDPVKVLPSSADIMNFAKNSDATDNKTLEEHLISHNSSWCIDTYSVKIKEIRKDGKLIESAKNITVVVVYDNEPTGKTEYGRVQLYASCKGIGIVNPAPMYICRPLDITAIDGSWGFKTGVVDSYKIVYSYFGVTTKPIPVVPDEEKEIGCPVENITDPIENETAPITQENKTSEIKVFIKNATSGDSADLGVKINEPPTEKTLGYYTEAFRNLLLGIFGGN